MPLCRDPKQLLPLLQRDEPGTRSIRNLAFGRARAWARWVRVDDPANPRAVILRSGARYRSGRLYMYADNDSAARVVLAELRQLRHVVFAGTPRRLARLIREFRPLARVRTNYLYVLNPGRLVADRSHRVETLKPEDAATIAPLWANGRQKNYIRWRISVGPTCAIRRQGRLVAWGATHSDGSMAMLRVREEYRGQGMARAITYTMARRVMAWGLEPFLHINRNNAASIRLTESMGFERHGVYAWMMEEKR
jgi:predicted GNAT family acetyltransferase